MKWADYCISKISFNESGKNITDAFIHVDEGETIAAGATVDRNSLVQKASAGKTFCCITKSIEGKWDKMGDFKYENGGFKWEANLPKNLTKRKSFLSYYHKDDEEYRKKFENLFVDLIVNKSVNKGDIDTDNSNEYIKQLIQKGYLHDTTVLIVLLGPKTKCRIHIDWEISGALNYKVGETYSGLLGIKLPNHPDYGKEGAVLTNLPVRLGDNFKNGYAVIKDWTNDRALMQTYIEMAFSNRSAHSDKRINSRVQMAANTCE